LWIPTQVGSEERCNPIEEGEECQGQVRIQLGFDNLAHFFLQFDYLPHPVSLIYGGPVANNQISEKSVAFDLFV
jgi:hypothetical protein